VMGMVDGNDWCSVLDSLACVRGEIRVKGSCTDFFEVGGAVAAGRQ